MGFSSKSLNHFPQVNGSNQRQQAAIAITDVANFSGRMAEDEEHTLAAIRRDFQKFVSLCDCYQGRVLKTTGDGLLIAFTDVLEATRCAIAMQQAIADSMEELPERDVLHHRIGIDVGEVFFSKNDAMGHVVNLAERLQSQAEPGGICLSEAAWEKVRDFVDCEIAPLGKRRLKNIRQPLPLYQIPRPYPLDESHPDLQRFRRLERDRTPIKRLSRSQIGLILASSVLAASAFWGMRWLGWLQPMELWAFDRILRLRPEEPIDPRLLIIAITEEDIRYTQQDQPRQGSLSDRSLQQLLAALKPHQPRLIGIDIYRDFSVEPDRPELSQALSQSENIVAICKSNDISTDSVGVPPPPEIEIDRVGFSDFLEDADGVLRRQLIFMTPDETSPCTTPYAFSLQLASRYLYEEGIEAQLTDDGDFQFGDIVLQHLGPRMSGYQAIDDRGSQILLNYRAVSTPDRIAEHITLTEALEGRFTADQVRDRIVLVGVTAPSGGDYWGTPYGTGPYKKLPGVLIQAQMISQIVSAALDDRPLIWAWPAYWEGTWLVAWALVGATLAWWLRQPTLFAIASIGAIALLITCCVLIVWQGGWIPLLPAAFACLVASIAVASFNAWRHHRDRRLLS